VRLFLVQPKLALPALIINSLLIQGLSSIAKAGIDIDTSLMK